MQLTRAEELINRPEPVFGPHIERHATEVEQDKNRNWNLRLACGHMATLVCPIGMRHEELLAVKARCFECEYEARRGTSVVRLVAEAGLLALYAITLQDWEFGFTVRTIPQREDDGVRFLYHGQLEGAGFGHFYSDLGKLVDGAREWIERYPRNYLPYR